MLVLFVAATILAVSADEKVKVGVYGEALCPDTNTFYRSQLAPFWKSAALRQIADITLNAYGNAKCSKTVYNDYSCECQHGLEECLMNQMMDCVIDQLHDSAKYIPILMCLQGHHIHYVRSCFRNTGVGFRKMINCAHSRKGRELQYRNGQATPTHDWIPWITINGVRSKQAETAFTKTVCDAYTGKKPPACGVQQNAGEQ